MGIPELHQKRIARDTMRMHCAGALIVGGMNHPTAAALLRVQLPADCTCKGRTPETTRRAHAVRKGVPHD